MLKFKKKMQLSITRAIIQRAERRVKGKFGYVAQGVGTDAEQKFARIETVFIVPGVTGDAF